MATIEANSTFLSEMLLERLERETDPDVKAEVMKRLELSRFMYSLVEDREKLLEQIISEARQASEHNPSTLSPEELLKELHLSLALAKACKSKFAMKKIQQEASQVVGEIIACLWAADADLKCED